LILFEASDLARAISFYAAVAELTNSSVERCNNSAGFGTPRIRRLAKEELRAPLLTDQNSRANPQHFSAAKRNGFSQ
jgi:hypothetical protein